MEWRWTFWQIIIVSLKIEGVGYQINEVGCTYIFLSGFPKIDFIHKLISRSQIRNTAMNPPFKARNETVRTRYCKQDISTLTPRRRTRMSHCATFIRCPYCHSQ